MARVDPLATYREKRNFRRTPEPRGRMHRPSRKPIFVIQQHAARALHYDFRLESGGVLKSWAVPKGPSLKPKDKRLAMPTEDHPLEYSTFEGVIPEGEYGAGRMIVWDTGTYRNATDDDGTPVPMEDALRAGRVRLWLDGAKLHGGYAFTRIAKGQATRWLLVKKDDEFAEAKTDIVRAAPESVLTGRSIQEVNHVLPLLTTRGFRNRDATWVKPLLVAEVAFTEWTRDGKLRHSRFLGLRSDKPARGVTREHPTA
jgi:DNA ligase D-like protein (predicted 3'-phosphoesterase)